MKLRKTIAHIAMYALLLFTFVVFVFPFFLMIINSFKSNGEILTNPFSLPTSWAFDQFFTVIDQMEFMTSFKNSLVITALSVLIMQVFAAMTAYYLVRNNNLYSKIFFSVLVVSMIIPFQSVMIPLMTIYGARLNLIERLPIPLLIVLYGGFGSALNVFFYHGFIKSVPKELEEAALIDGCNTFQTFFKIVFPMLGPTTLTVGILNVMWIWNDYLLPSLILTKNHLYTMPIKMKVFNGTYMNNWELLIPALLLTILPILVVYFIAQRGIIKGVMQGAIK